MNLDDLLEEIKDEKKSLSKPKSNDWSLEDAEPI